MTEIEESWEKFTGSMKHRNNLPAGHPKNIQSTIAHTASQNADEIVIKKKSRFS